MAQPIARDAEDFARLVLRTVARLGERGDWVPARDAYEPDRRGASRPPLSRSHRGQARAADRAQRDHRAPARGGVPRHRAAQGGGRGRTRRCASTSGRRRSRSTYRLPQERAAQSPAGRQAPHGRSAAAGVRARHDATALTERAARSPWRRRLLPRAKRRRAGRRECAARVAALLSSAGCWRAQPACRTAPRARVRALRTLVAAAARARPDARRRPGRTLVVEI